MKRKQGWLFFIIFLLSLSIYLLINYPLQLGLDLKGGSQLTLQLVKEEGKVSKEEMEAVYSVLDKRELCEYIISDLINSKPYDIYVVVKNDVGISKKSNKVTVVPSENSGLNIDDNIHDFSIQSK